MKAVNLAEKFSLINEHWSPRLLGELNNQAVKIA
ncbi:MAG: cupin domain-containing protein, partial [Epsilonproteobacteria bacterium]